MWNDDRRLARRGSEGDERAFAAIFRRHHRDLYRFCLAILGDREDAEDALQNTMVSALRALPGESRRIELKPWLYRIAHNESIDLVRRRRPGEALDPELVAADGGPAREAETRERLGSLLADLKTLPERQRGALLLRELSGLGFAEIGTALGCSAAVARQTVYEARLNLRQTEAGREMDCIAVTKALSDGDGRVARRRDIRAHLRSCPSCTAFQAGIGERKRDLAALSPLPGAVAAGLLQGVLGGGGGGGGATGGVAGTLGAGAAKTTAGSLAVKATATVAVVAAIGVGAERGHLVDVGLPGGDPKSPASAAPADGAGRGEDAPVVTSPAKAPGVAGVAPPGIAAVAAASAAATGPGRAFEDGGTTEALPADAPSTAANPIPPGHEKRSEAADSGGQGDHGRKATPQGAGKGQGSGRQSHPVHPQKPEKAAAPPKGTGPEPKAASPSSPPSSSSGKAKGRDGGPPPGQANAAAPAAKTPAPGTGNGKKPVEAPAE